MGRRIQKEVKKGAIRSEIARVGSGVDLLLNALGFWQDHAAGWGQEDGRYSRTPLIRINWANEPSG
jgi:hypothetical protein